MDFYSDLAGKLVRNLPVALNKFFNNSTKQDYMNILKSRHNFELCNTTLETIKKILACLDSTKAHGLDRISSKYLKDGAEVLALPLCNLVNLSTMVSIISLTEDFFGTRKCLLRCWTNKKWWSAKNYLRATLLPNI